MIKRSGVAVGSAISEEYAIRRSLKQVATSRRSDRSFPTSFFCFGGTQNAQNPENNPIKTPTAATKTKPAAVPERKMTEFQELACDMFGSFLFEGAMPDMIRVVAAMQWNREFPDPNGYGKQTPEVRK